MKHNNHKPLLTSLSNLHEMCKACGLQLDQKVLDEKIVSGNPIFYVRTVLISFNSGNREEETFVDFGTSMKQAKEASAAAALRSSHLIQSEKTKKCNLLVSNNNELWRCLRLDDESNFQSATAVNDLVTVAKLLKVPLLHLVPSSENEEEPILKSCGIYRRGVDFGGFQVFATGENKKVAYEAASCRALESLRSTVQAMNTNSLDDLKEKNTHFSFKSFLWRLQLLSHLRGLTPSFHIEDDKCTCTCSMASLSSTCRQGKSIEKAKESAARQMFDRLKTLPTNFIDQPTIHVQSTDTNMLASNKIKFAYIKKKNRKYLQDRADTDYIGAIHPVHRLSLIQAAQHLPPPVYSTAFYEDVAVILPDKASLDDDGPRKSKVSRSPRQFQFSCSLDGGLTATLGDVSWNKRMAKRSAAEAVLSLLGRPVYPHLNQYEPQNACLCQSAVNKEMQKKEKNGSNKVTYSTEFNSEPYNVSFSCAINVMVFSHPEPAPNHKVIGGRRHSRTQSESRRLDKRGCGLRKSCQRRAHSAFISLSSRSTGRDYLALTLELKNPRQKSSRSFSSIKGDNRIKKSEDKSLFFFGTNEVPTNTDASFFSPLKLSLGCSGDNFHCATIPTAQMEDFSWRLLEQLSGVFLVDLEASNAVEELPVPSADEQLISLCERLLIPIRFVELPPPINTESCVMEYKIMLQIGAKHLTILPPTDLLSSPSSAPFSSVLECSHVSDASSLRGGCFLATALAAYNPLQSAIGRHRVALAALHFLSGRLHKQK